MSTHHLSATGIASRRLTSHPYLPELTSIRPTLLLIVWNSAGGLHEKPVCIFECGGRAGDAAVKGGGSNAFQDEGVRSDDGTSRETSNWKRASLPLCAG